MRARSGAVFIFVPEDWEAADLAVAAFVVVELVPAAWGFGEGACAIRTVDSRMDNPRICSGYQPVEE
jgi:hypothetical protein